MPEFRSCGVPRVHVSVHQSEMYMQKHRIDGCIYWSCVQTQVLYVGCKEGFPSCFKSPTLKSVAHAAGMLSSTCRLVSFRHTHTHPQTHTDDKTVLDTNYNRNCQCLIPAALIRRCCGPHGAAEVRCSSSSC